MSRTLGSFNRHVNLENHREDYRPKAESGPVKNPQATEGYLLGLRRNKVEREQQPPSGAEKFVSSRGVRRTVMPRMAGAALVGSAEQRNQQLVE
jgi:hypothetical protein